MRFPLSEWARTYYVIGDCLPKSRLPRVTATFLSSSLFLSFHSYLPRHPLSLPSLHRTTTPSPTTRGCSSYFTSQPPCHCHALASIHSSSRTTTYLRCTLPVRGRRLSSDNTSSFWPVNGRVRLSRHFFTSTSNSRNANMEWTGSPTKKMSSSFTVFDENTHNNYQQVRVTSRVYQRFAANIDASRSMVSSARPLPCICH